MAITPQTLLARGLEFALGDVKAQILETSERQDRMLEAFGVEIEPGVRVVRQLRDMPYSTNPLPTWLAGGLSKSGESSSGDELIDAAIEKVRVEPDQAASWIFLLIFGAPILSPDAWNNLKPIVQALDFKASSDLATGMSIMRMAAQITARQDDVDAAVQFLDKLTKFAEREFAHGVMGTKDELLNEVIEGGASASKSYRPGEGIKLASRFFARLSATHGDVARVLRSLLDALVDTTPTGDAVEIWSGLLSARLG
jgi:hypothetical protein